MGTTTTIYKLKDGIVEIMERGVDYGVEHARVPDISNFDSVTDVLSTIDTSSLGTFWNSYIHAVDSASYMIASKAEWTEHLYRVNNWVSDMYATGINNALGW